MTENTICVAAKTGSRDRSDAEIHIVTKAETTVVKKTCSCGYSVITIHLRPLDAYRTPTTESELDLNTAFYGEVGGTDMIGATPVKRRPAAARDGLVERRAKRKSDGRAKQGPKTAGDDPLIETWPTERFMVVTPRD
ncbi:hypothetical protein LTR86_011195 [Recurvomyces mirabilis]|nr:hypothetical protein LTR86_011195 [Recurvomyces mirabilis]